MGFANLYAPALTTRRRSAVLQLQDPQIPEAPQGRRSELQRTGVRLVRARIEFTHGIRERCPGEICEALVYKQ